ncbi:MAG: prepilin-type N-terminal cleavage/methylation domain-containing protein [Campylobacteraceae bacterium]|nr:prepilin-type N-terminal cleavage/methylation domain-containing protein [Campylobacteraceae bacterium]
MKRAFTLLEVIISIAIFALMAIYMYQSINVVTISNGFYERKYSDDERTDKVRRLFYNDLFLQTNVYANATINRNGDFDIFYLHTKNSIHAMTSPYVTYFVNDGALFRVESQVRETVPLNYQAVERVKVDKLFDNVTLFRIYENRNSYLISYYYDDKLTSFQISLPPRVNTPMNNTNRS